MKLSIIIPTKDRPKKIEKILKVLIVNNFFFNEILIIDSSKIENKEILKRCIKKTKLKIKLYHSKASISHQRNIGLNKMSKTNDFYMLLDDDITFKRDAFINMRKFIKKNKFYIGYSFNLIEKENTNFLEDIKKSSLTNFFHLYDKKIGKVTKSGWHTKIKNVTNDTEVMWLSSCCTIFRNKKKLRFDNYFSDYSYLEDLDFSYRINKFGKLVVVKDSKYYHRNFIKRDNFKFGVKELVNRFYFVNKNNLNFKFFFIGCFIKIILNLFQLKITRFFGNIFGLIKITTM